MNNDLSNFGFGLGGEPEMDVGLGLDVGIGSGGPFRIWCRCRCWYHEQHNECCDLSKVETAGTSNGGGWGCIYDPRDVEDSVAVK